MINNEQSGDGHDGRARLRILVDVAEQLAREAGLELTGDIADLVAIAYVGILDTPAITAVTRENLLHRCRQSLLAWAWEQGNDNQPLPGSAQSLRSQLRHDPRAVGLRAIDVS